MSERPEPEPRTPDAPADALDAGLAPGTVVGGYRLEERLGQGGAGTVFAAADPETRARVAIKVLRRALADDAAMVARFEREARAVRAIRHTGIVEVLAVGRLDDGRPYLVMALLEGESLGEALARRGALPPAEAWRIARNVADALDAAHAAGVVHRDLKPDNVYLERSPGGGPPRVRLLDFGIAKVLEREAGADPMKLTATGVPLGTPAYMAPEQWWASGVTERTDQYALGVMLFEMLAGKPPFASPHFAELVQQHVNQPPPTLEGAGVHVPEAVEALVARLLAKAADDRFGSMRDVIDAGDRAFSSGRIDLAALEEAPASTAALHAWRSLHAAIVVLGFAGVVAVGYGGAERHDVIGWIRIGGAGQFAVLLAAFVATIALVPLARRRAETGIASRAGFWLALAPAILGAFTTYSGLRVVLATMQRAPALDQLQIFSLGTEEANAARFLGFCLAALLCLSVAAMPGVSGMGHAPPTLARPPGLGTREALLATGALGLVTILAAMLGAPSASLIAGTAAVAVGLGAALPTLHPESAARDELERAASGILAVGLVLAAGITRIEAQEASVWGQAPTRAARVAGILASQAERDVTLPLALAALAVFAAAEGLRLARLDPRRALRRLDMGAVMLAIAAVVGAAGDLVQHGRFGDERAALRAELGAQFALFSQLDPPPGDVLAGQGFDPRPATAVQVTRDVLAVDGRGVAKLAALDAPEGALHVAADLDRALAQAALEHRRTSDCDLSVSIDREVTGDTLLRLFRIARGAGVRRIELLLTRGASPDLGHGGPPEVDVVLPHDFVALPAVLEDTGLVLPANETFERIAPTLVVEALATHGPIALAVSAPR